MIIFRDIKIYMEIFKLSNMTNGWFVGDFEPSIYQTKNCEVAVKTYVKGSLEPKHFHKESKEITLIVDGSARLNEFLLKKGDIIMIEEGEIAEFEALENVTTVVFKSKSVKNDKFIIAKNNISNKKK